METTLKVISSLVSTYRNSKRGGKIAIVGSTLFFIYICFSIPISLFTKSPVESPQPKITQDDLASNYVTSQVEENLSITQTAMAFTFTPEPTNTSTPLPTATLTSKEALFLNIASCVPKDTEFVEAYVVDVIDGNTIDVQVDTEIYRVRYIGVDTPEKGEMLFEQATMANMNLVYSKKVVMIKDVS